MTENKSSPLRCQFNNLKAEGFSSALSKDHVSEVIAQLGISFRERIFTPFITLYAFIYQCLEDDASCRHTVAHLMLFFASRKQQLLSPSTGSYCKARSRLPVEFFSMIAVKIFNLMSQLSQPEWQWKHGIVKVVDGTGFVTADTKENLAKFQRHNSLNKKHRDSGFPMGRLLAVFCFATGGLVDLAIAGYKGKGSGELSLIHQLWHNFKPGETLLGDCLFSSYGVVATAIAKKMHVVAEFRPSRMKHLSKKFVDQIIEIKKGIKPETMDKETFKKLQDKIKVRIVKITCAPNGFRPKVKWLLTTHLDARTITAEDICLLYRQRWQAELNFRYIKTVLKLEFINAKSPEMVEKQIWTHMIAYNLVRMRMAEAGKVGKKIPTHLSFRAAQQIIVESLSISNFKRVDINLIYFFILAYSVGKRPDRYEPRVIKKRNKNFAFLRDPRHLARQRLHKKFTR